MKTDGTSVRAQVIRLIKFDPTLGNSEIARVIGCSRALVHWHTRTIHLPRKPNHVSCVACKKRVRARNVSGMCRECRWESYAYEFICDWCHVPQVALREKASQRRQLAKADPDRKQFCNNSHASFYCQKIQSEIRKERDKIEY